MDVEVIVQKSCLLGEGGWWDARRGCLWWFDGFARELYLYHPATGDNRVFPVPQSIGCAIPARSGGVVLCLQDGVYRLDPDTGALHLLCGVEADLPNNRLNDGGCDSLGNLWFGSMSMTANQEDRPFEVTGSFYSLSPAGELTKYFGGVGISNGIAWNADETILYRVDTTAGCVFAHDFDGHGRALGAGRVAVRIPQAEGSPDGMTIDREGMLWIAHFGGGQVSRWDPARGSKLDSIRLPVTNVTCCCFGGEDLEELYITTARTGRTPAQLQAEPLAGSLFRARPGCAGTLKHPFGG